MDGQEVPALLREQIEASNRTTHAVRALTSFIVYEAAYSLAALILLAFSFFPTLALGEPWWVLTGLAGLVAVVGLVHSFSVAFRELSKSEVTAFRNPLPRPALKNLPSGPRKLKEEPGSEEKMTVLPGTCDCGVAIRRSAGAETVGDSYVCRNCYRAIFDY